MKRFPGFFYKSKTLFSVVFYSFYKKYTNKENGKNRFVNLKGYDTRFNTYSVVFCQSSAERFSFT